eukprot:1776168-Alexandrium_andersonii.AAC.1
MAYRAGLLQEGLVCERAVVAACAPPLRGLFCFAARPGHEFRKDAPRRCFAREELAPNAEAHQDGQSLPQ